MNGIFKFAIALCLIAALTTLNYVTGFTAELFEGYKMSRVFIPVFIVGIITIWVIQFRIEKKNLK